MTSPANGNVAVNMDRERPLLSSASENSQTQRKRWLGRCWSRKIIGSTAGERCAAFYMIITASCFLAGGIMGDRCHKMECSQLTSDIAGGLFWGGFCTFMSSLFLCICCNSNAYDTTAT